MNENNAKKNSALIRISVYSTIAIVLVVILIMSLLGKLNIFHINVNLGGTYNYPNSDKYMIGNATVDPSDVKSFNVDWISGSIKIVPYDGDVIKITESCNKELEEQEKLRYHVQDGTLYIKFWAPRKFAFFNINNTEKYLTVNVPESLASAIDRLDIESISASVETDGMTVRDSKLESISGKITAAFINNMENITAETVSGKLSVFANAEKADINSISGEINFTGYSEELDAEAVSGRISLDLSNCPKKLDVQAVSGKIALYIPENDGFTAKYDTVSGDFNCDFNTSISDKKAVYKSGAANFSFETVSGDIEIFKK